MQNVTPKPQSAWLKRYWHVIPLVVLVLLSSLFYWATVINPKTQENQKLQSSIEETLNGGLKKPRQLVFGSEPVNRQPGVYLPHPAQEVSDGPTDPATSPSGPSHPYAVTPTAFPVPVPPWAQSYEYVQPDLNDREGIPFSAVVNPDDPAWQPMLRFASTLPSAASGGDASYISREAIEDGLPVVLTRFLNPVYGGWVSYQHDPQGRDSISPISLFSTMFSPDYLRECTTEQASTCLPIMADWADNDYGRTDLIGDGQPRWYGQVTAMTIGYHPAREATSGQRIKVVADVTYTSFLANGKTTTSTNRKLELILSPNHDPAFFPGFAIDGASLKKA